jgi:hypothetical protein
MPQNSKTYSVKLARNAPTPPNIGAHWSLKLPLTLLLTDTGLSINEIRLTYEDVDKAVLWKGALRRVLEISANGERYQLGLPYRSKLELHYKGVLEVVERYDFKISASGWAMYALSIVLGTLAIGLIVKAVFEPTGWPS